MKKSHKNKNKKIKLKEIYNVNEIESEICQTDPLWFIISIMTFSAKADWKQWTQNEYGNLYLLCFFLKSSLNSMETT